MSDDKISTSEEMDEWVVNIKDRIDKHVMTSDPTRSLPTIIIGGPEKPSIFGKWQCRDDFGVTLLPETTTWQFVAYMARWFGLNVRSYINELQKEEDLVWSYYKGVDERFRAENGKWFIEHLLANSCFLMFAMVTFTCKEHLRRILGYAFGESTKDQRSIEFDNLSLFIIEEEMRIQSYMLTMDYQIPWFVVDAVYTKHSNLSKLFDAPINKLALLCFYNSHFPRMHKSKVHDQDTITGTLPPGGFKHLLHIFHWSRSPKEKFLWAPLSSNLKMDNFYIPSATELQLSATVFEKHAGIHVSYCNKRLSGVMQITPWRISKYSLEIYVNLLRFEQGYMDCGFPATAYVACMLCLLQTKEDVRLLQDNDIISSIMDENDILSSLQRFKTIVLSNDVPMPGGLHFVSLMVREHRRRSVTRYYGEFKSRYCSNPWITISVIAGILLFVLTSIQTLYGTLSYYKQ